MVDLGGAWGGQESYSASIMDYLTDAGWRVSSLSGQNRHRSHASEFYPVSLSYRHFPQTLRLVERLQRDHDLVHFNGIRAIYLSCFCKKKRPFIGTKHSRNPMALQRNAKTALAALSAHLAFRQLDRLICVSDRIRDELPAGVRKRALVIRNGVEDRQGGCTAAPGEVPTLCYVGSISESKGLMRLLEAAQILKRRLGRFRLLMAGTGPWEEEAHHYVQQQRLEGTVQMLGFVENAHEVYGQSHVFVLPSLYEGLPLTLLEASAAGCALVGHNVPGVADVIRDGDNGLFAPVSAEGLADTLEALICDRGYRESLCRGARRAYEDQWRAERMLSETMAVYDILTDEAPHGRRSALRRRR